MIALGNDQRALLRRIKSIGQQVGASPKQVKAAIETGLVESNLRNLPGGDRDSAGWRQERASIYRDPTNLDASIRRFYSETSRVKDQYGSAGSLAAAVQRPAAQYRGRYQQRAGEAQALLGGAGTQAQTASTTRTVRGVPVTPGGEDRSQLLAQYLLNRNQPGALTSLAGELGSLKAPVTKTIIPGQDRTQTGEALAQFVGRANAIDAKQLPYQWGGGHAGKVNAYKAQPLDCSGAVAAVLGINPRVSGQFTQWGKSGEGDGSGVVVYANAKHVLMSIGGKFFGTSASNPGGGAGWIPRSKISADYLKNFTARHL